MLKIIPVSYIQNGKHKYSYSAFSEYLGSHIFNMLGIPAQETIFGQALYQDSLQYAVACKDFTGNNDYRLYAFGEFVNSLNSHLSLKSSLSNGKSSYNSLNDDLCYKDIINYIKEIKNIDPEIVLKRFWDQFICDAFIGNFDRHNFNWGFLQSTSEPEQGYELAPVFDNGSSLSHSIKDKDLELNANNPEYIKFCNESASSALKDEYGKMINYSKFLSNIDDKI